MEPLVAINIFLYYDFMMSFRTVVVYVQYIVLWTGAQKLSSYDVHIVG